MSELNPPAVEAIGLAKVWFFRRPSSGREFPFVAFEDLFASMAVSREMRRVFRAKLRSSKEAAEPRKVATDESPVTIVIDGMAEADLCQRDHHDGCAVAGTMAHRKLTVGEPAGCITTAVEQGTSGGRRL